MGSFSRLSEALANAIGLPAGTALHPREPFFKQEQIGAVNGSFEIPCDGCSTTALYLGGAFNQTFQVWGTPDGTNYFPILMYPHNQASLKPMISITGATPGMWQGECAPYIKLRVQCTAWTSGGAMCTLVAENGILGRGTLDLATEIVTSVGAAGAAVTLTLPSPGVGLRNIVSYIAINRFAAAALTAAATPATATTSGFPGSLAFSLPADAAAQGLIAPWREDLAFPIPCTAQNSAMTIVLPATPNVIWRATAGFLVKQ